MLRGLTNFLNIDDRQARTSQHRSLEGNKSGESKQSTFHPLRLETICVQPDIGTVLRDRAEHVWAFLSTMMWSCAKIETKTCIKWHEVTKTFGVVKSVRKINTKE